MKAKMKFDLGGIKNWLLAHGEKVAFGVVGLVFLMLVYSTVKRESLEAKYEPDRMKEKATSVGQHVESSTWDPAREQVKVVNYAERAKSKPLPTGTYAMALPLNRPVADPKAKRAKPEVVVAEDVRVAAGMDIFQVKGDKNLKALPWAVVTALVPLEKQRQSHKAAFAEAIDYDARRDVPQYLQPVLERAVVNPAKPDQLTWEPVATDDVLGAKESKSADIVLAKYTDPALTAPLGTLAVGQWGESVAHPKIPLRSETSATPGKAAPAALPVAAAAGAVPARPVAAADDAEPILPAAGTARGAPGTRPAVPEEPQVEHLLLRAFDYTVQPGTKYRYRVTLKMANPNSGIAPQYLQDPQTASDSELQSEPTDASAVVTIPDGHDVVAGPVEGGSRTTEPTAKVLVTAIDSKSGLRAATEIVVRRGSVANTEERDIKVRHPIDRAEVSMKHRFNSNILVLDIHGGKVLSRRRHDTPIASPGEVLLLDPNGNITVRNEIDDRKQFEEMVVREAPAPKKPKEEEKRERDGAPGRKPAQGGRISNQRS